MVEDSFFAVFFINDPFGTLKLFSDIGPREDVQMVVDRFIDLLSSDPDDYDVKFQAFVVPSSDVSKPRS